MSTFNILTKIFPFLPLLLLFGCPSYMASEYSDYPYYNNELVTDEVIDISIDTMDITSELSPAEVEKEKASRSESQSEEILERAEENYTNIQREEKLKNIIESLDSINTSLNWKLLKDNLYINKKGQLGLQIDYATEVGNTKYYISNFTDNDHSLNKVIDTASFKHLGSTFYKDKNNIYHYFDMAYGGRFTTYNIVDYDTFHVIGDHYAKDKDYIYGERAGKLLNVDYKTFTSEAGAGPYAKDKFGYYFWNELIMTHDELYKKYKRKSISALEFSELIKN